MATQSTHRTKWIKIEPFSRHKHTWLDTTCNFFLGKKQNATKWKSLLFYRKCFWHLLLFDTMVIFLRQKPTKAYNGEMGPNPKNCKFAGVGWGGSAMATICSSKENWLSQFQGRCAYRFGNSIQLTYAWHLFLSLGDYGWQCVRRWRHKKRNRVADTFVDRPTNGIITMCVNRRRQENTERKRCHFIQASSSRRCRVGRAPNFLQKIETTLWWIICRLHLHMDFVDGGTNLHIRWRPAAATLRPRHQALRLQKVKWAIVHTLTHNGKWQMKAIRSSHNF